MDTRLATTNIRIQQWAAVFKAKAESGLTVDEYCDQNGITRNAYYYWLRRVRAAALKNTQTTFVELKAPETEAFPQALTSIHSFTPQLTIEKNGLVIGVNSNTPKELLALALEAVSYV
jgi:transposase-like protein